MGARASLIAVNLISLLRPYVRAQRSGFVFDSECGYKAFPHAPKQVRFPDVSFVRRGRLPNDELPDGHILIPPDLATEVVSPNDLAEAVEQRLMDYVLVKVSLIWVVYPSARCVRVLRNDGTAAQLTEADELKGEDLLPGFACPVAELFREE